MRETYDDVWHLAERVVFRVPRLLVLPLGEVDRDDRIRDIALLCDEGYATRASGHAESVKFELVR